MPEVWQWPVTEPRFVDALVAEIVSAAQRDGRKPTAFGTRVRFSDAGKCARAIAYSALGLEGDGIDPPGLHVAWIGTKYHEFLQSALERRYPGCEVEVKGQIEGLTDSGSADAVIRGLPTLGDVLFELKTKSSYRFDKAVGYLRKAWKSTEPEGPAHETILQAGLNALAQDCESVVIGYVTFENISPGAAGKLGLRQLDRFCAEWHIPKGVWRPMVEREINRLGYLLRSVDGGTLPERTAYDETADHQTIVLAPEAQKPHWRCTYCDHRTRCEMDGPGQIPIPVDIQRSLP